MSRTTLVSVSLAVVAMVSVACGGGAPAGGALGTSAATATAEASAIAGDATAEATSGAGGSTDEGGLPAGDLTVEQLCAALTAEELGEILGETVTVDPAETVWCGYDLDDGSGMLVVGNNDTAEEFMEQAQTFDCDAKEAEGGAVISSCGQDEEEGRPSEAWFLLNGVGVQLSVEAEATEAQYLEMIRQALD